LRCDREDVDVTLGVMTKAFAIMAVAARMRLRSLTIVLWLAGWSGAVCKAGLGRVVVARKVRGGSSW
jgi:hypothetical protein